MPPTYFFLIDVTKTSVESGYLEIFASTVKNIIDNQLLPTDDRTQVLVFLFNIIQIGIMTYDNSLHFYNLSCKLSQPQMIVMNEQDPYIPIPV
jgi:protein transport protein SEC24